MTNKNSHANSDATSRHEEKNGLVTGGIYTCTREIFFKLLYHFLQEKDISEEKIG